MKIGIVGDIHFCEYSSILRSRGKKYSTRLENCIESINFAENATSNCDLIVYLGDFFDKSSLNAPELTALSEICWNYKDHIFLVGNHEMGINNLLYSSAYALDNTGRGSCSIVDEPLSIEALNCELCFLPYILEENKESSIKSYFGESATKRIIFSHNDISGIQLGKFISKAGFNIEDIESSCNLFINGHLHNEAKITNKIINLGNLTGQNFSEDGFIYDHHIMILDTDTLTYELLTNPYAINFYKITDIEDIYKVKNAVVTVKTSEENLLTIKQLISNSDSILASRIIVDYTNKTHDDNYSLLSIDHLNEFRKFVLSELGNSDLIMEELDIIDG